MCEDPEEEADIAAFDAPRDGETFPAELVDRLIDGEHPVRAYREYRQISTDVVCREVGMTEANLRAVEAGEGRLTDAQEKAVAALLDVEPDDLRVWL
ncbi:helix-turn-helix domain-containing protein [Parvularcula oceani]|uniref:helix-turn-helix domain-containing protein n=1 Tax=Parvularcula oceani TaxID=1247963 RepID=UPI00068C9E24|nr:helix-turn-helix transcriptional regulator [Parvularcula oceani]